MHIIINNSSMVPIYEQIMDQIKAAIVSGELAPNSVLPSIRALSKELKISALTVKKVYDNLEQEGFTVTVHGKGTYIAESNKELLMEEHLKEAGDLFFEVRDNGLGMTEEQVENLLSEKPHVSSKRGSGIGVKNVNERIRLYFGERYGLAIVSEPDEGTVIRIRLPAEIYRETMEKEQR